MKRRFYTPGEIATMRALRQSGRRWSDIATAIGRSDKSVLRTAQTHGLTKARARVDRQRRLAEAEQVAKTRDGIGRLARLWGISRVSAWCWLNKHAPDLKDAIQAQGLKRSAIAADEVLRRLQIIRDGQTRGLSNRAIGRLIWPDSPQPGSAVHAFVQAHAADGIAAAIADLEPEREEAA